MIIEFAPLVFGTAALLAVFLFFSIPEHKKNHRRRSLITLAQKATPSRLRSRCRTIQGSRGGRIALSASDRGARAPGATRRTWPGRGETGGGGGWVWGRFWESVKTIKPPPCSAHQIDQALTTFVVLLERHDYHPQTIAPRCRPSETLRSIATSILINFTDAHVVPIGKPFGKCG